MGLDRRSFLMFVLGGAAGGLFTPMMWKPIDDISIWSQNWPWIPRNPSGALGEKSAVVKLGGPEYGVKIKTVGGQPCQVYGDEDHPLSKGGIEPLGAAAVRLMRSPARITAPMKKSGDGFEEISWKEAEKMLADKLAAAGGAVACISGDETGSTTELLSGLLTGLGSSDMYLFPSDASTQALVWQDWMGGSGQVGYDLENANYVLILGADVLGSWGAVVSNSKAFAANSAAKFVYAGPSINSTSVVCDKWIPLGADAGGHLALAIAYYLLRSGSRPMGASGVEALERFVQSEYSPDKAEKKTGVPAGTVQELARELMSTGMPVVVTGSPSGQGASAFDLMAGMCLNVLLDRINKSGGVVALPQAPKIVQGAMDTGALQKKSLIRYLKGIEQGQAAPKVLMVHEANPYFALPQTGKAEAALDKIPFKVSFGTFMDETAAKCDLILPNAYLLERSDDSYTPFGSPTVVYTVSTPVADQAYDTKPTADVVLGLAKSLGVDLGVGKFDDLLEAKVKALGGNWRRVRRGQAVVSDTQQYQAGLNVWNEALASGASAMKTSGDYPLALVTVAPTRTGSRMLATPPGVLLAVSETEIQGSSTFIRLNSATAGNIGVADGDMVKVSSPSGEIQAKVSVFEGVMTGAVIAPLGFGHTAWDEYSQGKGANVSQLLTPQEEAGVYQWSGTRVRVEKI